MNAPQTRRTNDAEPVGLALAAVVAGLGAGKAPAVDEPHAQRRSSRRTSNTYVADPTNRPASRKTPI